MSSTHVFLVLCCVALAAPLRCFTCLFPAITPMDCLKFPQECSAGQRCLASTAVGVRGAVRLVLYEKSCALTSQCGLSGEKYAAGLNFTYSNECCDTDLCNGASTNASPNWGGALLCLLPALVAPIVG